MFHFRSSDNAWFYPRSSEDVTLRSRRRLWWWNKELTLSKNKSALFNVWFLYQSSFRTYIGKWKFQHDFNEIHLFVFIRCDVHNVSSVFTRILLHYSLMSQIYFYRFLGIFFQFLSRTVFIYSVWVIRGRCNESDCSYFSPKSHKITCSISPNQALRMKLYNSTHWIKT